MKKRLVITALVVVLLGAIAVPAVRVLRQGSADLPTARVARGDLDLSVYTTGELRASRSAMVVAPPVMGTLQIVSLVQPGSQVKSGDLIIEFDPSEQEFNLDQSRSELAQAEQEIVRRQADAAVQEAQDQVALLKARFAVRRAELDLGAKDLVGAIEARKNELSLEEAQRRLAQLQQDIQSKGTSGRAALTVLEARRDKSRLSMLQARQNIESMKVRAPIDGVVVLRPNMDASGGMYYSGMSLPEYRKGDMVWPGRTMAEILDNAALQVQARVGEADRANLSAGQKADIRVNGLPVGAFGARLDAVGGAAARSGFFFDSDARRGFDATLKFAKPDERLRPGLAADVVISGQQLKGVLYVPRQALFEKNGKPVVYVRNGNGFESRTVKIAYRSESRAVIEGLDVGTEVALVDPEAQSKTSSKGGGTPSSTLQGGPR